MLADGISRENVERESSIDLSDCAVTSYKKSIDIDVRIRSDIIRRHLASQVTSAATVEPVDCNLP